jgi:acyl-CoA synthetase (AMP-forming)/AMP-acid ligase II
MNLAYTLQEQSQARPQAAAIIDTYGRKSRITTFAELDQAAARAARLLLRHGLEAGDAVLVFHPMSAELYVALLAVFRLRLVAMFLDPSAGREHIERCCALHRPKALIAGTKAHLLRLFVPALRRIQVKFVIGWPVPGTVRWSAAARQPPLAEIRDCPPETPALLTFTSGSTGQPKAAVRTHGFLLAQHRALAASLELTAGDVDLATLPIVALANLGSGVTSLIPNADLRYPGAIDPIPVVAQVLSHRATSSVASPAFFECLVRHCGPRGQTLPSLTKLFTGGAPVFPRLLDQLQLMAPQARVFALYGSTEAEPIAHVSRSEIEAADRGAMIRGKGLLAGMPVDTIQLRILRDQWGTPAGPFSAAEFAAQCRGPGEPGEIVVSGDHVLPGYLRGQGDEETKIRVDGAVWHRTGDAGYLDARNRLWLLGRCVARIQDSRGELYPFAAETAVYTDSRVRRAAMVAHRGKRILALEWHDGQSDGEVDTLRAALAWTHIDEVRVCKRIPVDKRHNAKIDYPALYQLLERHG